MDHSDLMDKDDMFEILCQNLGLSEEEITNSQDPVVKMELAPEQNPSIEATPAVMLLRQGNNPSMGWLRSNARAVKHEIYVPVPLIQVYLLTVAVPATGS